MNNKFFIIVFFGLVLLPLVSAGYNESYDFNISQLPINGTTIFDFSLIPNSTISFELINSSGFASLSFPDNVTLNESGLTSLVIDWSLPEIFDYMGNYTYYTDTIEITNDVNNVTTDVSLHFNISHIRNVSYDQESYLIVTDNSKVVKVKTNNLVNFSRNHTVVVRAKQGTSIDVSCGRWITGCPDNVVVETGTNVSFIVNISVEANVVPGFYVSYINFSSSNNTDSSRFEFTITGDYLYTLLRSCDVAFQECYKDNIKDAVDLSSCYKELSHCNSEVARYLLDESVEDYDVLVNETIKYVEVGNVDPELFNSYNTCLDNYNTVNTEVTSCHKTLTKCLDDYNVLIDSSSSLKEDLSNAYIVKRNELNLEVLEQKKELDSKNRSTVCIIVFVIFVLFALLFLVFSFLKSRWILGISFPVNIFGYVSLLLLLIFFIMLIVR